MTITKLENIQVRYISNVTKNLPLKYDFLVLDENAMFKICLTIVNALKTLESPLNFVNSQTVDDVLINNDKFISDESFELDDIGNNHLCIKTSNNDHKIMIIIYLHNEFQVNEYTHALQQLDNNEININQEWLQYPENFVFRNNILNNTFWGYELKRVNYRCRYNSTDCINPLNRYKIY